MAVFEQVPNRIVIGDFEKNIVEKRLTYFDALTINGAETTSFLHHFLLKTEHLSRQARDKHRES
jgi:hypothetical protein